MSVNIALEMEIKPQSEAQAEGLENHWHSDQNCVYQNGLTLGDWLALLHQNPPSAASRPSKMTYEHLRRENIYEDRA